MITMTILSCLQIGALLYLGAASIRMNRLQTLSKNFDWVLDNPEFVKKYGEPLHWPLVVIGIVLNGVVIAAALNGSAAMLVRYKYMAIFPAVAMAFVVYYVLDKKLSSKIPLRKERTANLHNRTLDYYVRPSLVLGAKIGIVFSFLAVVLSYFIQRISLATLVYDLVFAVFCYSLIWGCIYLGLKEKIPHQQDISRVTNIDVGENFRLFSMNLQIGALYFFVVLVLFCLGIQWFGFDIAKDSLKELLHRLLGETASPYRPIFSLEQWDTISSLFSIVVWILVVKSRPFREIISIRLKPVKQNN